MNAIIAASRDAMLGSTMYLVGLENDGSYVENASPCAMCKRLIINAGIERVVIRNTKNTYTCIKTEDWIANDDSLEGRSGY